MATVDMRTIIQLLFAIGCSCIYPMKRPGSLANVWRNLKLLKMAGDPLWYGDSRNIVPTEVIHNDNGRVIFQDILSGVPTGHVGPIQRTYLPDEFGDYSQ